MAGRRGGAPADRDARPLRPQCPHAHAGAIDQIAASIKEWGWTTPVLIAEDSTIIAGHGRVLAAQKLGMTEIPVMIARGWTEAQKKAYVLADNQLALNAGWDDELLKIELAELKDLDFDLDLLGFDDKQLHGLLAGGGGLTDPDQTPEPPAEPVSVAKGDVWVLGQAPHRLRRLDGRRHSGRRLLNGAKPHLMVTDPPYGVEYDPDWRNEASARKRSRTRDSAPRRQRSNDDRADWREAWALFPGDVAYVWHRGSHAHVVAESLGGDFEIRSQIIWNKTRLDHRPRRLSLAARAVLVRRPPQRRDGHWAGDRKQSTVWDPAHARPRRATAPRSRSSA
jgi:hypothetical protein